MARQPRRRLKCTFAYPKDGLYAQRRMNRAPDCKEMKKRWSSLVTVFWRCAVREPRQQGHPRSPVKSDSGCGDYIRRRAFGEGKSSAEPRIRLHFRHDTEQSPQAPTETCEVVSSVFNAE